MVKETYVQDQRDTPIMYNLLVDQGIPTAKCFPLKSAPHSYSLKLPNDNSMFVQNFLFGHELQPEEINARPELWYKIGKMIRQFHVVGSSDIFTNRKWKTEKFDITKVDEWFKRKYEVKYIQEFRKDELISRLEVLKQKSAELNTDEFLKGLIHDDWYTTCFILDDAQNITGLLDFNTAGMEFVVQDAFRDNHYWEDKQFADIFFEGYFAISPEYSEEEIMSLPILDHARSTSLIDYFGWKAEHNMTIGLPEGEDVMQGYWDFTNDFIDFDYDKSYPSLERIVKYTRDYNKLKE